MSISGVRLAGKAIEFPNLFGSRIDVLVRVERSDGGVPPKLLFDAGFGELFVAPVAGNGLGPPINGTPQHASGFSRSAETRAGLSPTPTLPRCFGRE